MIADTFSIAFLYLLLIFFHNHSTKAIVKLSFSCSCQSILVFYFAFASFALISTIFLRHMAFVRLVDLGRSILVVTGKEKRMINVIVINFAIFPINKLDVAIVTNFLPWLQSLFRLLRYFFSRSNTFLNLKQAIARFPQLVRHPVAAQHPTTAGPTTQNCTPAPIRAPGEAGGPQPTR